MQVVITTDEKKGFNSYFIPNHKTSFLVFTNLKYERSLAKVFSGKYIIFSRICDYIIQINKENRQNKNELIHAHAFYTKEIQVFHVFSIHNGEYIKRCATSLLISKNHVKM